MLTPRFSPSSRKSSAGTSRSCKTPPRLPIAPDASICTTIDAGNAVVRIIALLHLVQKKIRRNIALLQNSAALADRSRRQHLHHDRRRERGSAHHRAHVGLGIVVVHHGEGSHASLEPSAE